MRMLVWMLSALKNVEAHRGSFLGRLGVALKAAVCQELAPEKKTDNTGADISSEASVALEASPAEEKQQALNISAIGPATSSS